MTEIFRAPFFQPDSINGVPLAGALLYFYAAGTTTPISIYQDSGLSTPATNPLVADASGIFAPTYLNVSPYKIVLKTSAAVTVYTADNITAATPTSATTSNEGTVTLATLAEAAAGTSTTKVLTAQDGTVNRFRPNLFWNPQMEVSQQNGTTLGTINGYFITDSLAMYFVASAGAVSGQQVAVTSLNGSIHQAQWKCTTINASPAVGNFDTLTGKIEGLNATRLRWGSASAIPATLSFNFTGPAGTYNVHIQNRSANRHIAIPFTPAVANTEERITVVVPKDTSGTWTVDNDTLLTIDFMLVVGSTFVGGSASTWGASTFYAAAKHFNSRSNTSNTINITDVQFSPDPDNTGVAPAWVPVDIRTAQEDSKRYFRSFGGEAAFESMAVGCSTSSTTADTLIQLSPAMRSIPTLPTSTSLAVTNGSGSPQATTGNSVSVASSTQEAIISSTVSSGLTTGQAARLIANNSTSARLQLAARLT